MEKAIVSTTIGAEGLPVRDGEELRIADTPETFAAAVVELLRDPRTAKGMGQRAGQIVREKFGWNGVSKRFTAICESTIQNCGNPKLNPAAVRGHEQPAP